MADKSGVGTLVSEQHELATDSLDLFSFPAVEQAQISGRTQTYYLHGTLTDDGPFEFHMPNESNEYTKLDSLRLYGEVEVIKADNTAVAIADEITVLNNFPQTLFKQIEVSLNNVCVNDLSTNTYAYKAYIENHLSYGDDMKKSTLAAREMYYKDIAEGEYVAHLAKAESGAAIRRNLISGKRVRFDMPLHVDFLHVNKYLIPGVEMKIRLQRNDNNFCILAAAAGPKIKFHNLELTVRKITIDPAVSMAIENNLNSKQACYPVAHSKIKTILLNSGTQSHHLAQVFRGKLPRSFIMCMVNAKAYDGDPNSNAFKFQHFNLKNINVFVDGDPIHPKAMEPEWTDTRMLKQYSWFLDNIGLHHKDTVGITLEDFKNNSCFFPYDLSPDLCNAYYSHGTKHGTIDVALSFAQALTENVIVIFYATFDEAVTIDKLRTVTVINNSS